MTAAARRAFLVGRWLPTRRFIFACRVQDAREQFGMVTDAGGDGPVNEGADGFNKSLPLCHAEQAQHAGYFQPSRQGGPSSFPLVDADPLDPEFESELNHGGFALVEGRHRERGERAGQRLGLQPVRSDPQISGALSFVQLVADLFGADEQKRQLAGDIQCAHALKGDQRAGVDNHTLSHGS